MSDETQQESEKPESEKPESEKTESATASENATAGSSASDSSASESGGGQQLPPANFMVLLSTLATQAMASLGFIPDPSTGKPNVNRPMAKHFIDMLAMLQEKTKGNLDEEETNHLRDALHQLRMTYVSSENIDMNAPPEPEEKPKSSIVLP